MLRSRMWRSSVWDFFTDAPKPQCRICPSAATLPQNRNTGNLERHLLRVHLLQTSGFFSSSRRQSPISHKQDGQDSNSDACHYRAESPRALAISQALASLVFEEGLPLSFVERPSLRRFMNVVDPRYQVKSRRQLTTELLPEQYAIKRNEVYGTACI